MPFYAIAGTYTLPLLMCLAGHCQPAFGAGTERETLGDHGLRAQDTTIDAVTSQKRVSVESATRKLDRASETISSWNDSDFATRTEAGTLLHSALDQLSGFSEVDALRSRIQWAMLRLDNLMARPDLGNDHLTRLREALEAGRADPRVTWAHYYMAAGDISRQKQLDEQAIESYRKALAQVAGAQRAEVEPQSYFGLTSTLKKLGRNAEYLSALNDWSAGAIRRFKSAPTQTVDELLLVTSLFSAVGNNDRAEVILETVLAPLLDSQQKKHYADSRSKGSKDVTRRFSYLMQLSSIYTLTGRAFEARRYLLNALTVNESLDAKTTTDVAERLAYLDLLQGHVERALQRYRDAWLREHGPFRTVDNVKSFVAILRAIGRQSDADKLIVWIARHIEGPGSFDFRGDLMELRAELAFESYDYANARIAIEEALTFSLRSNPAGVATRARRLNTLARIELAARDKPAAILAYKRFKLYSPQLPAMDQFGLGLDVAMTWLTSPSEGPKAFSAADEYVSKQWPGEPQRRDDLLYASVRGLVSSGDAANAEHILRLRPDRLHAICSGPGAASDLELLRALRFEEQEFDASAALAAAGAECVAQHLGISREYDYFRVVQAEALESAGRVQAAIDHATEVLSEPMLAPVFTIRLQALLARHLSASQIGRSNAEVASRSDQTRCSAAISALRAYQPEAIARIGTATPSRVAAEWVKAQAERYGEDGDEGNRLRLLNDFAQASEFCTPHDHLASILLLIESARWAPTTGSPAETLDLFSQAALQLGAVDEKSVQMLFQQIANGVLDNLTDTVSAEFASSAVEALAQQSERLDLPRTGFALAARLRLAITTFADTPRQKAVDAAENLISEGERSIQAIPPEFSEQVNNGLWEMSDRLGALKERRLAFRCALLALSLEMAAPPESWTDALLAHAARVAGLLPFESEDRQSNPDVSKLVTDTLSAAKALEIVKAAKSHRRPRRVSIPIPLVRMIETLFDRGYTMEGDRLVSTSLELQTLDPSGIPDVAKRKSVQLIGAIRHLNLHDADEYASSLLQENRPSLGGPNADRRPSVVNFYVRAADALYRNRDSGSARAVLEHMVLLVSKAYGTRSAEYASAMAELAVNSRCNPAPDDDAQAALTFDALAAMSDPSDLGIELIARTTLLLEKRAWALTTEQAFQRLIESVKSRPLPGDTCCSQGDFGDFYATAARHAWSEGRIAPAAKYWERFFKVQFTDESRPYELAIVAQLIDAAGAPAEADAFWRRLADTLTHAPAPSSGGPPIWVLASLAEHYLSRSKPLKAWDSIPPILRAWKAAITANSLQELAGIEDMRLRSALTQLRILPEQLAASNVNLVLDPGIVLRAAARVPRDTSDLPDGVLLALQMLADTATAREIARSFGRVSIGAIEVQDALRNISRRDEEILRLRSGRLAQPSNDANSRDVVTESGIWQSVNRVPVFRSCDASEVRTVPDVDVERFLDQQRGITQTKLKGAPPEALRKLLAEQDRDIETVDASIPRLAEGLFAQPSSVAAIRSKLGSSEAILVAWPASEGTYLALITASTFHFHVSTLTNVKVNQILTRIRGSLELRHNGRPAPYEAALAYQLYADLFAPLLAKVPQRTHVLWIAGGALQSLPPHILLTSAPQTPQISDPAELRTLSWLAKSFDISILLSVSNVMTESIVRPAESATGAPPSLLVFADPDLHGTRPQCLTPTRRASTRQTLEGLCPLPQTADIAPQLAPIYFPGRKCQTDVRATDPAGGGLATCLSGGEASQASLQWLNQKELARKYSTIVFATHGLTAKEAKEYAGINEPALVLSATGDSENSDGLLTTSEIAQLSLSPDLVMLTACNTASPSGEPDAEMLSGLARAFFEAGAKSVLVSEWSVQQSSTVELILAFAAASRRVPPSKALGQAMSHVGNFDNDVILSDPGFAHPAYWGPFVIVGRQ